ncbi:MAG TPA: response regulator, partial [Sphingomicrobium sp.]|nr:response regulator [Sphingomicrobium sp.]
RDGLGRVAAIVRSMKEFAHPDRKEMAQADLNQAIKSTLVIASNEYKYVAEVETDLGDLPLVNCYAGEINQVVLNLIVNAAHAIGDVVKETQAKGKIRVATRVLDDQVEIAISDTGKGIPVEVRAKIFDPFFTTKEVGKGTGLGLSMVYGMARQSGGDARIESGPGSGTTVRLLFRKADVEVAEAAGRKEEVAAPPAPAKPLSILVIDDDPDVREFIVEELEEQGYRVQGAADGNQGLAEIERAMPDLVIVDFIMPGMSGAEIARAIRERRPEQPILFVSGYSETEAVKRTAPDAPLLAKPFRTEALHRAVRGAMADKG